MKDAFLQVSEFLPYATRAGQQENYVSCQETGYRRTAGAGLQGSGRAPMGPAA
jgi:hypothetical protein